MHPDQRIAAFEQVAIRPVRRGFVSVQEPSGREQDRTRASAGDDRSGLVLREQPSQLFRKTSLQWLMRWNGEIGHAHDVVLRGAEARVWPHQHPIGNLEGL